MSKYFLIFKRWFDRVRLEISIQILLEYFFLILKHITYPQSNPLEPYLYSLENIGPQNTGWLKPEFVSDVMIILEFQVTLGGIIASLFIVAYSLVHKKTLIISTMSGSKAPWRPSQVRGSLKPGTGELRGPETQKSLRILRSLKNPKRKGNSKKLEKMQIQLWLQ